MIALLLSWFAPLPEARFDSLDRYFDRQAAERYGHPIVQQIRARRRHA